jgi:hypothetical protein
LLFVLRQTADCKTVAEEQHETPSRANFWQAHCYGENLPNEVLKEVSRLRRRMDSPVIF